MKSACGLLLAVVVLAGCGYEEPSAAEKRRMEARFAELDYETATIETGAAPHEHLARLTRKYIALVREYEDQLGTDEAKRRLAEKAAAIAPYCLPCTATLDSERRTYSAR